MYNSVAMRPTGLWSEHRFGCMRMQLVPACAWQQGAMGMHWAAPCTVLWWATCGQRMGGLHTLGLHCAHRDCTELLFCTMLLICRKMG